MRVDLVAIDLLAPSRWFLHDTIAIVMSLHLVVHIGHYIGQPDCNLQVNGHAPEFV